jgi:hypothetical protein
MAMKEEALGGLGPLRIGIVTAVTENGVTSQGGMPANLVDSPSQQADFDVSGAFRIGGAV